jgi:hypothetical protein
MPKRVPFHPLRPSVVPTLVPKREPIPAKYPGQCRSCGGMIGVGDAIRQHPLHGWIHAECREQRGCLPQNGTSGP